MLTAQEKRFNEHATFLSEIAVDLLNCNDICLHKTGVREIIALYLLIPYISKSQLKTPGENYVVPQLQITDVFTDVIKCKNGNIKPEDLKNDDLKIPMTLENLRNTICHSAVFAQENSEKTRRELVIDCRSLYDKKPEHDTKGHHSDNVLVPVAIAHERLKELHNEVIGLSPKNNRTR